MSSYTAIDLSQLAAPEVVESLDFETIFAAMLSDLQTRDAVFTALVESDPAYKILEVAAYRELLLRQRINDSSRSVMLAYATGSDLDHLGALFGVARLLIAVADLTTVPPTAAVMESDTDFRRRIQLSLEGFSTAGPEGAYVYWALSADPDVLDASATSPSAGNVVVSVLSRTATSSTAASPALLAQVNAAVNADSVRPLTDAVTVRAADIKTFVVTAALTTYPGPDSSVILTNAQAALATYLTNVRRIGFDVTLSGIYAALHQPGVQKVSLTSPASNISVSATQVAICTASTVTIDGTDE